MNGNTLNISDAARALCVVDDEMRKLEIEIQAIDRMIDGANARRYQLMTRYETFEQIVKALTGG